MSNLFVGMTSLLNPETPVQLVRSDFSIFAVGVILLLIWEAIRSRQERSENQKKKESWQKFAINNHLDFIRNTSSWKDTHVTGNYRGYCLNLYGDTRLELIISHSVTNLPNLKSNGSVELTVAIHGEEITLKQAVNRLAPILSFKDLPGEIQIIEYGNRVYYQQVGVISEVNFLQTLANRLSDIMDYYRAIVDLGGEAVPFLETLAAHKDSRLGAVTQLLEGIAKKTTSQLSQQASQLLCPRCFVSFGTHRMSLSWMSYYGCRTCGQSREFLHPHHVNAVLNTAWAEVYGQQGDILRINWLARRTLFDFDQVEIIQATDEDVEHFAVQVGNDTDPVREPRYRQMKCIVGPECRLSENTLRILQHTFGLVEQSQVVE